MVGAGHHVRAKTNSPVIGILTQPFPENNQIWDSEIKRVKSIVEDHSSPEALHNTTVNGQFIETSHVKFLESAGARVVPIDYTLNHEII